MVKFSGIYLRLKNKRIVSRAIFFFQTDAAGWLFILIFYSAENGCGNFFIKEILEMESRINKQANITGNGPQRPNETTWSLPIMMLRNWKSVFFFFFFFRKQ